MLGKVAYVYHVKIIYHVTKFLEFPAIMDITWIKTNCYKSNFEMFVCFISLCYMVSEVKLNAGKVQKVLDNIPWWNFAVKLVLKWEAKDQDGFCFEKHMLAKVGETYSYYHGLSIHWSDLKIFHPV